jgi:hypothetical protein
MRPVAPPDLTPEAEEPRLSRQCRAILARLQRGPATNGELAEIALKYTGRISDLRPGLRAAGRDIKVVERDTKTGRVLYALVDLTEGGALHA